MPVCARHFPACASVVACRFLVVTCNYAARAAGVTKLMPVAAARAACPQLALVRMGR